MTEQPSTSLCLEFEAALVGKDGPPGPPGPQADAIPIEVGPLPLSGHSAVAIDAQGRLIAADCTDDTQVGTVLGVVSQAWSPGDMATVKTAFVLEHAGWNWVPGPVLVGRGGQLVQQLPAGAMFAQSVGFALSPTRVLLSIAQPIII